MDILRVNFKRLFSVSLLGCAAIALRPAAAAAQVDDNFTAVLRLLPAHTPAAIVVPSLKRLSDQIMQCLEGMDRANILMGSRPLDQLKAATGFNIGINDAGTLAIVLVPSADGPLFKQPAFIIPVSDAQAFLEGNFVEHDGDAYEMAGGATVYAKSLDSHVVLSQNAAYVRSYQASNPNEVDALKASFGERGAALADGGDMFLFGNAAAVRELLGNFKEQAAPNDAALPGIAVAAMAMTEDLDAGLTSLDFDPLGLIVRSYGRFRPETEAAKLAEQFSAGVSPARPAHLSRLPNKPFHFALSIDLAAAGGAENRQALMKFAGLSAPWMSHIEGVQVAAYPSPAGLNGGLLNDAALALLTSTPEALRQSLRDSFGALQVEANGVKREVTLEIDKPVKDCGLADAYEIKAIETPPDQMMQQMVEKMVLGAGARRGFIAATKDSVIVTFSQRPAVLGAALQAATADAADGKRSLDASAAIKIMRQWMPSKPILELYIGVGRLLEFASAAAAAIPQAHAMLPQLNPAAPPLGLAVAAGDGGIESSVVIPAAILSALFDQAMKQQAGGAPRDEPLDPSVPAQDRD